MYPLCARCERPIGETDEVAMAATSTNFAMLFHSDCLRAMHDCAIELTDDIREWVAATVRRAMQRPDR